jgi:hypothetical protein
LWIPNSIFLQCMMFGIPKQRSKFLFRLEFGIPDPFFCFTYQAFYPYLWASTKVVFLQ